MPILRPFCNTVLANHINQKMMEIIAEGNMVYPKYKNITYWCIIKNEEGKVDALWDIIFKIPRCMHPNHRGMYKNTNAHNNT